MRLGRMGRCRARSPSASPSDPARSWGRCLIVASLLGPMLIAPAAQGSPTGRPHVRVLAPGVALTTYVDRRIPVACLRALDRPVAGRVARYGARARPARRARTDERNGEGSRSARGRERGSREHDLRSTGPSVRARRRPGPDLARAGCDVLDLERRDDADREADGADRVDHRGRYRRDVADRSVEPRRAGAGRTDGPHGRRRSDRGAARIHVLGAAASRRTVRRDRCRLDQDLQRGPGGVLLEPAPAR